MRRRESTLRHGSQPVKGSDGECCLWAMKTRSLRKQVLYLSVNVLSSERILFLRLLQETRPSFYLVIRATQRSSHLQGKGGTFISQSIILRVLDQPQESNPHSLF